MKRWVVATAFGVGACIGACQAGTPATLVEQQATLDDCYGSANYCDAKMPQPSKWSKGDPLPPLDPNMVVVTNLVSPSSWEAYGADPVDAKIAWTMQMTSSDFGPFMSLLAGKDQPFGGVRPPGGRGCPPNCVDPGTILAVARRTLNVQAQAVADRAACDKP